MFKHMDIWRAIDRLASLNKLSPSGLARKAGLSATLFNPSKRFCGSRPRWPSTESIAAILKATGTSLDSFVALASQESPPQKQLPLISLSEARHDGVFDEAGRPAANGWDRIPLPGSLDPKAFALEISGKTFEPAYREGDRLILAPSEKPRRGDRVVARTQKGDMLLGRLGREGLQKIELVPFQPDMPPLTLGREEIAWIYRIVWASQ